MSIRTRVVEAAPEKCWSVLADGWLYPLWVVGATRMRDVDASWPAVGSRLHHSVGTWPFVVDDDTEVVACEPGERLTLRARAWPAGEAHVDLRLEGLDGGRRTEIGIEERAVAGPGRLVPAPLEDLLIGWRNGEALQRLAMLIEGR
jgi:uncharacterized protein YndB with AHSA1/START domain